LDELKLPWDEMTDAFLVDNSLPVVAQHVTRHSGKLVQTNPVERGCRRLSAAWAKWALGKQLFSANLLSHVPPFL
jgi:hypothetical protein